MTETTTPTPTPTPTAPPPNVDPKIEADRQLIREARAKGRLSLFGAFVKLSGPGWLQAAITLGGGSLAGSLILGSLAGYSLMWVQPLAMVMGIIMLSAIGYVVLSTGQRPFEAINQHVNPVLGWLWLLAAMTANFVWCMPQFGLAVAALQQNLGMPSGDTATLATVGVIGLIAAIVVWFYNSGGAGIKLFEIIVKLMVALIVVSFVAVVGYMSYLGELPWNTIFSGYVPDFSFLTQPAPELRETIETTGNGAQFWSDHVVSEQRDRMITVAATAVGINMTFLLPYSMLARGWNRDFRGMAIFDLATALFIPFIIVTSCLVIAASAQMYNQPAPGLLDEAGEEADTAVVADDALIGRFESLLDDRVRWGMQQQEPGAWAELQAEQSIYETRLDALRTELSGDAFDAAVADDPTLAEAPLAAAVAAARDAHITDEDRRVAAVVVQRDSIHLANALQPLEPEGMEGLTHIVFGVGVLGVAMSTIVILMLINGFVFSEVFATPANRHVARMGSLLVVLVGAAGYLLIWRSPDISNAYFVVPTSVIGMILAPIAYIAFVSLMNNRNVLGDFMPTGFRRIWWNTLMFVALAFIIAAAGWALWTRTDAFPGTTIETRWLAISAIVFFFLLGLLIHVRRRNLRHLTTAAAAPAGTPAAAAAIDQAESQPRSGLDDLYDAENDDDSDPFRRPD